MNKYNKVVNSSSCLWNARLLWEGRSYIDGMIRPFFHDQISITNLLLY